MTYTKEEQKKHREELVTALRSGDYNQAKRTLRSVSSFCCLGVACDISGLAEWDDIKYLGEDLTLPLQVMDYYGFINNKGCYDKNPHNYESLSKLNDDGSSFKSIATLIESEPEGMFI